MNEIYKFLPSFLPQVYSIILHVVEKIHRLQQMSSAPVVSLYVSCKGPGSLPLISWQSPGSVDAHQYSSCKMWQGESTEEADEGH